MKLHTYTGQLSPTPPFDFSKSLDFLEGFSPAHGEQVVSARSLTKAVCAGDQTVVFRITSTGDVEAPVLEYTLFSYAPLEQASVADRMAFFLSLDDDLRPFYELARDDPPFAPVVEALYGYHQVKFLTPFESAAWAVLSQRNPASIARKMKDALSDQYGGSLRVDGTLYRAFPQPSNVAAADPDELATIIRNGRRLEYLSAVAAAFAGVDEDFLRTAPYEEVNAWLRDIKGIGGWSASFVLLRGLGRTERIPGGEERLAAAASRIYGHGRALDGESVSQLAERYGSWQGYWAHYLRVAF